MLDKLLIYNDSTANMSFLTHRQKILSENMANVDTPDYKTKDLKEQRYEKRFPWDNFAFRLAKSEANHVESSLEKRGPYRPERKRDGTELTISDNNVVLENEVEKVTKTEIDYRLATQIFKKYATLYNITIGANN